MIRFSCPKCSAVLQVADDKAGVKLACPKCKSHVRLRRTAQTPPPPPAEKPELPAESPSSRASDNLAPYPPVAISSSPSPAEQIEQLAGSLASGASENPVPLPPAAVSSPPALSPKAVPQASRRFLHRLLPALVAEFRAIFGVLPLLHRPVWIIWGLCFLAAFVGRLPGVWSVFEQLLVLTGLGLAGLFSGTLAKRVRRGESGMAC